MAKQTSRSFLFSLFLHFGILALFVASYFFVDSTQSALGEDGSIKAHFYAGPTVEIDIGQMTFEDNLEQADELNEPMDENAILVDEKESISVPDDNLIQESEIKEEVTIPPSDIALTDKPKEVIEVKKNDPIKKEEVIDDNTKKKVVNKTPTDSSSSIPKIKPSVKSNSTKPITGELTSQNKDIGIQKGNSSAKPVSRRLPEYPRLAQDRKITGYVIVSFDVNPLGKTENINIIEAKPKNIFNQSVISAVRGWKYTPNATKNIRIKIEFNRNTIKLD